MNHVHRFHLSPKKRPAKSPPPRCLNTAILTRSPAYTEDTECATAWSFAWPGASRRILRRKWNRELDYRPKKTLRALQAPHRRAL
jgi:nuclear transport factor 2 (NTF2) superfamily protein